ncbi:MAG: hypothetical protein NVSMB22_03760 [Chloroflexota bacterium]
MSIFPALEPHGDLHLIAILQKALYDICLEGQIVLADLRCESHLLQSLGFLIFTGIALFARLLVLILPIIDQAADRRLRRRTNLNKIEISIARQVESPHDWDNTELFPVLSDKSHLAGANLVIDA